MPDSNPTDSQGSTVRAVLGRFLPEGSEVWVLARPGPDAGWRPLLRRGLRRAQASSRRPRPRPSPRQEAGAFRLLPKEPLYCPLTLLCPPPPRAWLGAGVSPEQLSNKVSNS